MRSLLIKKPSAPALLLTPLLDMFTIILIFLIVSFEAEDYDFRLNPDLKLPESAARSVFKPAVNVAVTRSGVLVDKRPVATLVDGVAPAEDYAAEQMPPVVAALETLAAGLPEGEERIIMLQADKDLDYRTLYLVMRSARIAGFEKYRLAVMKK